MLIYMKQTIMRLYGANKLWEEIEQKKAAAQARKEIKEARRIEKQSRNPPPRPHPGMIIGRFKLLKPAYEEGYFQPISRGNWLAICLECGEESIVPHEKIAARTAYACCKKRPRKRPDATRPPNKLNGQMFGRLLAEEYKSNIGWVCRCLCGCGQREIVRYSWLLKARGRASCTNRSGIDRAIERPARKRRNWERT